MTCRLALTAILLFSPALSSFAGERPEAVAERVRESVREGTGGEIAAYALCQIEALVDFKDGNLAPELIPEWQRFERWAIDRGTAGSLDRYTEEGRRLLEASRSKLETLLSTFQKESRALALLQEADYAEWKRKSAALSNRASVESETMARELIEMLRKGLPGDDYGILQSQLQEFAQTLVVARFDHTRLDHRKGCR